MSSAAAQSLDGARVASVAVSVDEATPRARLLVDQVAVVANSEDLQLALVASELVAEASVVAVVAVAALVVDSGVIEEVSEEDSVAEAADEVTLVVVVEVSATVPLMAPQLVPAVHEVVALAAIEEAEVGSEVTAVVEDDTRTDAVVVVVVTTEDPAALTTNRSAAEIDTATAMVGTVEAETTAQGSAATKETATTTGASAADTRPTRWLKYLLQGFVKGYLPFSRLTLFRHEG
jgi:hypothetical protein